MAEKSRQKTALCVIAVILIAVFLPHIYLHAKQNEQCALCRVSRIALCSLYIARAFLIDVKKLKKGIKRTQEAVCRAEISPAALKNVMLN